MINKEDKWEENIKLAKDIFKKRKNSQMLIAKLAMEVCEIEHGGNSQDGKHTLAEFAKEAGLNQRTLWSWVNVRRKVYLKMEEETRSKARYINLVSTASQVDMLTTKTKVNDIYDEIINQSNIDTKLLRYASDIRGLITNLESKLALTRAKKQTLEEVAYYAEKLSKIIIREKIAPINHGLIIKNNVNNVHVTMGRTGDIKNISKNDYAIMQFLRTTKEAGPTEIGAAVFKNLTPMAQKLRAMRSCRKLEALGLVLNKKGIYSLSSRAR